MTTAIQPGLFSEIKDAYQPSLVAVMTLYNTPLSQVTSFTYLRQVVFRGMILPETLPSLRTLILRNHVPALLLSSSALPALCAVSAPFLAMTSLCFGCSIVKLDIRDEVVLTPLYKTFAEVRSRLLRVQELSLFLGDWDDELVYAWGGSSKDAINRHGFPHTVHSSISRICTHLLHPSAPPPQYFLKTNKSMHDIDPDTETNLEQDNRDGNYGIHHRRHARNSHNTLPAIDQDIEMNVDMDMDMDTYIYNRDSEPEFEELEELKTEPFEDYTRELVIAWNRACHGLRTVQLHPGWAWRLADPADCWVAKPCESGIFGNVFESPPCDAMILADIIKKCKMLNQKLYKHLILTSPTSFNRILALSSIQPLPHAFLLGIFPLVERTVEQLKEAFAVVPLTETDDWTPVPINRQSNRYRFFQIKDAYQPRFLADAARLRGVLLPRDLHSILHGLPNLRDLAVVHCTVRFAGVYRDVDPSLKLHYLTLLDIRAAFLYNDDDTNPRNPRTRLRTLASRWTLGS
ncbi:hypothetical protein CY34DRAFT_18667 [Suillus luteus UH-Slu-Lm8-n1]|uniref:Uncharacterized protein n=1 Tax=Suillus luteus UH-Slu-Lm8-n1 TaxID=930992 RepID=A0A0D0AM54_9AGAM|nr:hypothetical protein CY34DRAFT_18667 [Suillus luteus UH-Slu-Lm8-n1]